MKTFDVIAKTRLSLGITALCLGIKQACVHRGRAAAEVVLFIHSKAIARYRGYPPQNTTGKCLMNWGSFELSPKMIPPYYLLVTNMKIKRN